MAKTLSIITVHYRTPGLLHLLLETLGRLAPTLDHEVIIVDSGSTAESQSLIRSKAPTAKLLAYAENLGFARGVNLGLTQATGRYFLIINPDLVIAETAIRQLLTFLQTHPDVGMVGPQLRNFNGTIQQSYFSFYRWLTIPARRSFLGRYWPLRKVLADFLLTDCDPNEIQTPDWLMGSALLVSREAVTRVGPMDERFFMYFEDVDWARRFWHNGYKVVYFPSAVAYHYHQRESKSKLGVLDAFFNQKTRWHIRSAIKFFNKYHNLATPR